MSPICTVQKIISTIENISFILYVYYCHLNHLFCQILVGTPSTSIVEQAAHTSIVAQAARKATRLENESGVHPRMAMVE